MQDGGNEEEVAYSHCAARAISDALGSDSLALLANFLPSIKDLFGDIDGARIDTTADSDKGSSFWQLVFLLSSLLGAVLLSGDRHILLYYDDIQNSVSSTLALVCEIIISIGKLPDANRRLLFIGMYRDDEIALPHHFTTQYDCLKRNTSASVLDIGLNSLSKDDLTDMISTSLRLPRRTVLDFSDII
jgi:predicted ATPase